jgi:acyl-[acyl-carrier-protein]-phospholipid O-acyltransferase/long-chain-fatty-acid--[acyl-carrier-protein] ligase
VSLFFLPVLLPVLALVLLLPLLRLFSRPRVVGRENIPATGPVLLVGPALSWYDRLLLQWASPRPLRFLSWVPVSPTAAQKEFAARLGVVPLPAISQVKDWAQALKEARKRLAQGEAVCLLLDGDTLPDGKRLSFRRVLRSLRKKKVPIVPFAFNPLEHVLPGEENRTPLEVWRERRKNPAWIVFGQPLPPDYPAWRIRHAVDLLMADSFTHRKRSQKPVHRQFVRKACRHPFRSALIDPAPNGRRLNYIQTLTAGVLMARWFRKKLGPEKMVGLLLPTTVGGTLANIGVTFLGRTAVNLNYTASKEAMLSAIKQCGIKQVITAKVFRHKLGLDLGPDVQLIDLEEMAREVGKVSKALTYFLLLILPGFVVEYLWLGLGSHGMDDIATVIFSSGSTGDPKGVMLSQFNVASNIDSAAMALTITPKDRLMAVLPFFHSFGYTVCLWLPLLKDASTVLYPDPRQAKEIGDACREFGCTLFVSTPTFLRFILRKCTPEDFQQMRMVVTGAEKLPPSLAIAFTEKFQVPVFEGYGCTELSPVVSANTPDVEYNGIRRINGKPGAIGRPIPGVAVKVVDPNTFVERPLGEPGLLLVKGPNVMVGYLNRPEATREAMRDGWYVTGDIAKLDEDGFITITDRLSRFSKIAGEMVPHQRIEEEIQNILQTSERLCAVTAVPDEKKGEKLLVLHTRFPEMSVTEVVQKLNNCGLPNLWLPDGKHFYEITEMPVLGSGKLDLQKLKKLAQELAGKDRG